MYIRGFDGLRAVALLLVFFTHKTGWGEKAQVGFAGVWLFFLLSGFLITGQLSASRARIESRQATLRQEVTAFWIKRILRIFPAYYLLLALVVPTYIFLGHRDVPGVAYYATYLSNFFFQAEPAQFLTTFAHFWSLAVEEQFYIAFAPLLLFVPSRLSAWACGLVIIASLLRRIWLAHLDVTVLVVYIDSLVNFGILALGGLLYLRKAALARVLKAARLDRSPTDWIALTLLIASPPSALWLAGNSQSEIQGVYVIGAVAGAIALINVYLNQNSLLTNLLEIRLIAHFGKISYGLYLYNDYVKGDLPQRVIGFLLKRSPSSQHALAIGGRSLAQTTGGQISLQIVGLVVCLGLLVAIAQLSWVFVEKPSLRFRDWLLAGRPRAPRAVPTKGPIDSPEKSSRGFGGAKHESMPSRVA